MYVNTKKVVITIPEGNRTRRFKMNIDYSKKHGEYCPMNYIIRFGLGLDKKFYISGDPHRSCGHFSMGGIHWFLDQRSPKRFETFRKLISILHMKYIDTKPYFTLVLANKRYLEVLKPYLANKPVGHTNPNSGNTCYVAVVDFLKLIKNVDTKDCKIETNL